MGIGKCGNSESLHLPGAQAVTKGIIHRKGRWMWFWSVSTQQRRLELTLQGSGAAEDSTEERGRLVRNGLTIRM